MKSITKFIKYILPCAILFGTGSCTSFTDFSEDDEIIIRPGGDDEEGGDVVIKEPALNMISTAWEKDMDFVKSECPKGLNLISSDDDFLKYTNSSKSFFICYDFMDGKLRSSLLLIPSDSYSNSITLQGYNYLGNLDSAKIFSSASGDTMGATLNRTEDGQNYYAVGLSPFESDLFDTIDPIVVTTEEATDITTNSIVLNGSVTGYTENPQAYFVYSLNSDMSYPKSSKCTLSDGKFSTKIANLEVNSTVYFKARIIDSDITYDGSVEKAELDKVKSYAVGDPYPDAVNPVGIVCKIKNGGTSGYILSLDQETKQWDVNHLSQSVNATNTSNGANNNMGNASPFGSWVKNHGTGWYGPAKNEMNFSKSDVEKINNSMVRYNGTRLEGYYWTSTQKDSAQAWVTTVCVNYYSGYANGSQFTNSKTEKRRCIAMKAF